MNIWEYDKLYLFVMFVIPGFISMKTYELLYPSVQKDSTKQVIDAIAYSCINYALLLFFIILVEHNEVRINHPIWYVLFYVLVLFISPVALAFGWKCLRSTKLLQKGMPHPTLKPWDFVFSQRKPYWMKVTLNDGTIIGGKYSDNSFASSVPAPEQIYLEETWIISETGKFERAKKDSAGVIILSCDISFVELRTMKFKQKETENV